METDTQTHLPGTSKEAAEKGQEAECLDRFIKGDALENTDYEVVSEETWQMLSQKYGFDVEVRRYYTKGQWSYYSSLEVDYKAVPIILLFTDQFPTTEELKEDKFPIKWVQVRKTATYLDLKKRIADCSAKFMGETEAYKHEQLRMWSVNSDDDVLGSINKANQSLSTDSPMAQPASEDEELNSGVECPGNRSQEAYCGTTMDLKEKTFMNEAILVEVARKNNFFFKYTK